MFALALLAAAVAVPQAAKDPDVRCVAVFSVAAGHADAASRPNLMSALFYYIGRVDARRPGFDYIDALTGLGTDPAYVKTGFPADVKRCGAAMQVKGNQIIGMGQALAARSKQRAPK